MVIRFSRMPRIKVTPSNGGSAVAIAASCLAVMQLTLYQVDAFTDRLFGGNPAAVCPLKSWLPDATMQAIAAENNLAETAFFVPDGTDYVLRWFTPEVEVDLCGHATLASAFIVLNRLERGRSEVTFRTLKSGALTVSRDGELLAMNFPARPPSQCRRRMDSSPRSARRRLRSWHRNSTWRSMRTPPTSQRLRPTLPLL